VPLEFPDNLVLLDFAFEAAQGALKWFAFLQPNFRQLKDTSQPHQLVNPEFCSVFFASQVRS
jgi:hypothetical protein